MQVLDVGRPRRAQHRAGEVVLEPAPRRGPVDARMEAHEKHIDCRLGRERLQARARDDRGLPERDLIVRHNRREEDAAGDAHRAGRTARRDAHVVAERDVEIAQRLRAQSDLIRRARGTAGEVRHQRGPLHGVDAEELRGVPVDLSGLRVVAADRGHRVDVGIAGERRNRGLGDVVGVRVPDGDVPRPTLQARMRREPRQVRAERQDAGDHGDRDYGARDGGTHRDRAGSAAGLERHARADGRARWRARSAEEPGDPRRVPALGQLTPRDRPEVPRRAPRDQCGPGGERRDDHRDADNEDERIDRDSRVDLGLAGQADRHSRRREDRDDHREPGPERADHGRRVSRPPRRAAARVIPIAPNARYSSASTYTCAAERLREQGQASRRRPGSRRAAARAPRRSSRGGPGGRRSGRRSR